MTKKHKIDDPNTPQDESLETVDEPVGQTRRYRVINDGTDIGGTVHKAGDEIDLDPFVARQQTDGGIALTDITPE